MINDYFFCVKGYRDLVQFLWSSMGNNLYLCTQNKNLMPTTLTRPKTASKKTTTSQELKKEATKNKTATTQTALSSKKKKTIEELAERAQSIISKYDIPYTKNNQ